MSCKSRAVCAIGTLESLNMRMTPLLSWSIFWGSVRAAGGTGGVGERAEEVEGRLGGVGVVVAATSSEGGGRGERMELVVTMAAAKHAVLVVVLAAP
jgi:hypothetical protein